MNMKIQQLNRRRFVMALSIPCSVILLDVFYFNIFTNTFKIFGAFNSNDYYEYSFADILNTSAFCGIMKTVIMPEYLIKDWKADPINDCHYEKICGSIAEDDQIYKVLPEYKEECCFHEIRRVDGNDHGYTISNCSNGSSYNIKNTEMFYVKCGKYINFDANFPMYSKVDRKLKYWETVPEDSRPFNVLIFGIDTVSRSHAYRSIPKTVQYIKNSMGFYDFEAYHSIHASTSANFRAFLMGLSSVQTQKFCVPLRNTSYDNCPLIWKKFNEMDYVTFYLEDGHQTFNWGGQSGFKNKPTDYYFHSMFTAIAELRNKQLNIKKDSKASDKYTWCTSTESIPEFITRHTERFIRKFHNTPFFSFTWLAYPFHDYFHSLAANDDQLLKFFKNLDKIPNLLDNTMIVFLADHGDRYSFFQSKSIEGYLERSLPQFFIRFPERLKKKYTEFNLDEITEKNTRKLTTGFDLHHTLLHLLHLSNTTNRNTSESTEFNPVWNNRSSLLLEVDPKNVRNCNEVGIAYDNCACNHFLGQKVTANVSIPIDKVMLMLEEKLNSLVNVEKYKHKCKQWKVKNILSKMVITSHGNGIFEYLFKFTADPGGAIFEVIVEVNFRDGNYVSSKYIGGLGRINAYGKQSSCIDINTDKDKEMLQFCYCKDFKQS